MSYDIRVGVKVAGLDDCYAVIAEPEYHSPTYNLGMMFRACTGWNFDQGEWYKASEVIPMIEHGIHELKFNRDRYESLNPKNGWGNIDSALKALESMLECIMQEMSGSWSWNKIPAEYLYVCW